VISTMTFHYEYLVSNFHQYNMWYVSYLCHLPNLITLIILDKEYKLCRSRFVFSSPSLGRLQATSEPHMVTAQTFLREPYQISTYCSVYSRCYATGE
jgi:hypothetical protein